MICHSEPSGEESRFMHFYFVRFEILHFVQNDKFGFVGGFVILSEAKDRQ